MTEKFTPDNYMTERELADAWGMKRNTLQKWRSNGVGPKYIKRVGRIVYRKDDITEFERNNVFQGTNRKIEE
jgi:predicted site-specific integrase-resolvase